MRYSPANRPSSNHSSSPLLEELYMVPVDTYETENSDFFINKDVLDSQQNDFKCLYCGRILANKAGRIRHEKKHRRDLTKEKREKTKKSRKRGIVDIYACEICSVEFTNKASRTKHMKKHADVIECQICSAKFANKMDYEWHPCNIPEEDNTTKRTRSKSRLSLHSMSFNNHLESRLSPIITRGPSRTALSVKSLPYKYVRHDGSTYFDEISVHDDNYDRYSTFTAKSNKKSFRSQSRASSISRSNFIYLEEDNDENDENSNFFVNDYVEDFDNVFEEPVYTEEPIFDETSICPEPLCRSIFRNVDLLTLHEMIDHKKLALFRCVECRKRYTTSENLAKHRAIHYHQQSIPCPLCKVLQPAKDIVMHQNKHMKNCIKCNICELFFFDEFTYESHFPEHFLFIKNKVQILYRVNSTYGNMKLDKNFDEFLGDLSFNTIFFDNLDKFSINDIKENKPWRS